jgi:hypothetical protein
MLKEYIMEKPSALTGRRYEFPEPALSSEGVVAALRERVDQSRIEAAQASATEAARAAATEAVDAGRMPGVVIVPTEVLGVEAARLSLAASMATRY